MRELWMSLAIASLAIGDNFKEIAKVTHPPMRDYARKIGAEFISIEDQKISSLPYFEKFRIGELLERFDRVILFDCDLAVRYDCPNLFNVVPENMIGLYGEGFMATPQEQAAHRQIMTSALQQYYEAKLPETWQGEFYNTGVIVASKQHKPLFQPPEKEVRMEYWDQALLNARLILNKIPVHDIGYNFNRMPYVDKAISKHRLFSYIVHYAGIQDFVRIAKKDFLIWESLKSVPASFPRPRHELFDLSEIKVWDFEGALAPQWIARDVLQKDDYDLNKISFNPGDTVIDLGANIGVVSLLLAKRHPEITVFAVEPCRVNYEHLVMNIKENGVRNIKPFNLAITGDGRRIGIGVDESNAGGATIYGNQTPQHKNSCASTTLDRFMSENAIARVALLKCDIESAEFEVFDAFTSWNKIDRLSIEIHPPRCGGPYTKDWITSLLHSKIPADRLKIVYAFDGQW